MIRGCHAANIYDLLTQKNNGNSIPPPLNINLSKQHLQKKSYLFDLLGYRFLYHKPNKVPQQRCKIKRSGELIVCWVEWEKWEINKKNYCGHPRKTCCKNRHWPQTTKEILTRNIDCFFWSNSAARGGEQTIKKNT